MKRTHSLYALAAVAVLAIATTQSGVFRAQVSPFDWQSASCEEKTQEFNSILASGAVDKLTWIYEGVLDDIFGQPCMIMGLVQGIGYVTDSEILIKPDQTEGLYYNQQGNFYFITYTEGKTVAYVFTLQPGEEPYVYLGAKNAELMKMVGNARRLHLGMQEAAASNDTAPDEPEMAAEEEQMMEEAAPEDQSDLFDQIQDMNADRQDAPAERVLYRDGKIVSQADADAEATADTTDTSEVALEEEIGDDPVLQQLLKEQEEFFDTTDETANSDTETAVDEEVTDEPSEEVAVPAPKPAAGLGLGTILSGGAAIVLGIGFALFMLLKKKKKGVSAEAADAPPTPTAVADGPLQKSERLEKALASMDEKTEG
ncbi:hypothetical protein COU78_03855 [Candidatus Peregrinibacteria bacterium CG10_big_fil_rev_8_21_14_0_10_49_24]|nr:MAG: hypothetical protein COV83_00015 [Candidatus Peregrinibacteria bacterium CG11_big_fil_rev_8_21_14_0_20_49_14]PIR50939.1 MAG: hypothetical protein COU78_03855 [Candidatus Peregrinibacteria bacterium CG10_big_fil_rev_8_21_14_0_10_49_24]PJA67328.1 MAG: hypothetical protein CO157_05190 [Candidatus Peregrinibacteria bacterium CG_4_9_14_3_um_filter_49_12]